jgi:hypothetical protein
VTVRSGRTTVLLERPHLLHFQNRREYFMKGNAFSPEAAEGEHGLDDLDPSEESGGP